VKLSKVLLTKVPVLVGVLVSVTTTMSIPSSLLHAKSRSNFVGSFRIPFILCVAQYSWGMRLVCECWGVCAVTCGCMVTWRDTGVEALMSLICEFTDWLEPSDTESSACSPSCWRALNILCCCCKKRSIFILFDNWISLLVIMLVLFEMGMSRAPASCPSCLGETTM
jgi:hypothetical protein